MSKRTLFTTITPLPAGVTRDIVLDFLRNHEEMIDLNPLVKERHPIPTPPHAPADELECQWYSLTDKISYLPGVAGDITYTCAFHNLLNGIQTHCYAPAGLTIRDKWTVGGSLPGELAEPPELGLKAPPAGLYLREDVDMRCNVIMTSFVKKTLKKSHAALVDRLKIKAEIASVSNNKSRSNRNSGGSEVSSQPFTITFGGPNGAGIPSSQYPRHLSASGPINRPPSPASSAASTVSSLSVYSANGTPMWPSPRTSSLGTSPALSTKTPPTTPGSNYQTKPQFQQIEYPAQPKPLFATSIPIPKPETPFLRQVTPDWPLKTQQPSLPPAWPLKTQQQQSSFSTSRPYSQLYITAYRPHPTGNLTPPQTPNNPPPAVANRADSSSSGAELSDDALWQALGGGRGLVLQNGASYRANNGNGNGNGNWNGERGHHHARTQSQGHPEYPQMSPYDDDEDDGVDDHGNGNGNGNGNGGLGVVGGARPVSLPAQATLGRPFVAGFY